MILSPSKWPRKRTNWRKCIQQRKAEARRHEVLKSTEEVIEVEDEEKEKE